MTGQRRLRIVARLADGEPHDQEANRLCEVCAEVACVTGAAIMLLADDAPRGPLCSTDAIGADLVQLQLVLGAGPCIDAYQHDHPVLVPDLGHPSAHRWVGFTRPAVDAGVRAAFGFPLRIGVARLGALLLHNAAPGPLSDEQHADALVMADLAAQSVVVLRAGPAPGRLAVELEAGADFRRVVHQAAGMVAEQLGVTVGQALVRLRAHAFAWDRPLTEVAEAVVGRQLRFDGERDQGPRTDGIDTEAAGPEGGR